MRQGERVTLAAVADAAGVSLAAASRAINGRPGVREAVRDRVQEVADQLGFRPNRAAKYLASGESSTIGFIIPTERLPADPYGGSLLTAVGLAANAADLALMLHIVDDEPSVTMKRILRDRMVDGLIIASVALDRAWTAELFDLSVPVVLLGAQSGVTGISCVATENIESSAEAVQHLFDQGCERVAHVAGPAWRQDAQERLEGYRLAHRRAGRNVDDDLVVAGNYDRAIAAGASPALLRHGVDGVFCANDESAIGLISVATGMGIAIPDQLKVVGFDGTALRQGFVPNISSVVQPFDAIASTSVQLLGELVAGAAPRTVMVEPELVPSTSSRQ